MALRVERLIRAGTLTDGGETPVPFSSWPLRWSSSECDRDDVEAWSSGEAGTTPLLLSKEGGLKALPEGGLRAPTGSPAVPEEDLRPAAAFLALNSSNCIDLASVRGCCTDWSGLSRKVCQSKQVRYLLSACLLCSLLTSSRHFTLCSDRSVECHLQSCI